MQRNNNKNFTDCTLEELHQLILNMTGKELVQHLNLSLESLKVHIARIPYTAGILTIRILKQMSVTAARDYWQAKYTQLLEQRFKELKEYSLQEICQAIWATNSLSQAALNLKAFRISLEKYLSEIRYKNTLQSYTTIKNLPTDERAEFFSQAEYQQSKKRAGKSSTSRVRMDKQVFAFIHQKVRDSVSSIALAKEFNIDDDTLKVNINQIKYQGHFLTYEALKQLSIADAKAYFKGAYTRHMVINKYKKCRDCTLLEIWQLAQIHQDANITIKFFNTTQKDLKEHLKQFTFEDKPLNYDRLIKLSAEQVQLCQDSMPTEVVAALPAAEAVNNTTLKRKRQPELENVGNKKLKLTEITCCDQQQNEDFDQLQHNNASQQSELDDALFQTELTDYEEHLITQALQTTETSSLATSAFTLFAANSSNAIFHYQDNEPGCDNFTF